MQKDRPLDDRLDEFKSDTYIPDNLEYAHSADLKPCKPIDGRVEPEKRIRSDYFPGKGPGPKLINLDILSKAIANRVGVGIEEARRDAGFVLDLFGYDDRIIDNTLDPEDRQLFYILEEEGMLVTEREENTLYDGRTWRTHYWIIKGDTILRYSSKDYKSGSGNMPKKPEKNLYDTLPDDLWSSRKGLKAQITEKHMVKSDTYDVDFSDMSKGKTT
ncbi:MAG: hypothetical protein KAT37_01610 [Candidatus Aenigmarchaeota archaeon]|nr:hypothetical protein [Candidatus Aenigmarchaeota archaeon]